VSATLFGDKNADGFTISREICDRLVIAHSPDSSVAYQSGVDVNGNAVVAADLTSGIKIDLPKTVRIPIRINLNRYFRLPIAQRVANQKTLSNQLHQAQKNTVNIASALETATTNQTQIQNNLTSLSEQLQNPGLSTSAMTTAIQQNLALIENSIANVASTAPLLSDNVAKIHQNQQTLSKHFTPFEENSQFIQKDLASREQMETVVHTNQQQVGSTSATLKDLATGLAQQKELLLSKPSATGDNFDTLKSQVDKLEGFLNQALVDFKKANAAGVSITEKETLSDQLTVLKSRLNNLLRPQHTYVDYAQVGEVEMHLDGRLYFNGQPLYDEDIEKIKRQCQKYKQ